MQPHLIQNTPEWLEFRKGRITASLAPSIMSENPYCTPYQAWLEKTGRREVFVNDAMRHGTEMEPMARAWYEEETGVAMFPQVVIHPDYPDIIASLDGFSFNNDRAVEIKNPYNNKNHLIAVGGEVPPLYRAQLQHQMMCAELEEIDFCSYFEGEGVIITVKRDNKYIKRMLEKELEFLQWIKDDCFPNAPQEPETQVSGEVYKKIVQLKRLKMLMDDAKNDYEIVRNELMAVAGTPFNAYGCSLRKSEVKGQIDYKAIPELKGLDLEPYRKPGREQWKVTWN